MDNLNIKLIGILHVVLNVISGFLGTLFVVIVLLAQKNIDVKMKQVCYDIINFNISFFIYFFVSFLLMFVIIGFLTTPILWIVWVVLMILGLIKHIGEERYDYPLVIKFLK